MREPLPGLNGAALAWSRARSTFPAGHCLQHCREAAGLVAKYGSAKDAWLNAHDRHPGDLTPPIGALFFFKVGTFWHVVLGTDGKGGIRSTDWPTTGHIGETTVHELAQAWNATPLGWAEIVNDQPAYRRALVDVSGVRAALTHRGAVRNGAWVKKALAHAVGRGLMTTRNDVMGWRTKRRMRLWQRHVGSAITGIPSARDLALLGDADVNHLFNVQA